MYMKNAAVSLKGTHDRPLVTRRKQRRWRKLIILRVSRRERKEREGEKEIEKRRRVRYEGERR